MIDDARHGLAIRYVLGELDNGAARGFEAELQGDLELQELVDEAREVTAALAHAVPLRQPPPHLRDKVLAATARGEAVPAAPGRMRELASNPWALAASLALAAGLAVASVFLYSDRGRWRKEVRSAEGEIARSFADARSARDEATKLAEQMLILEAQAKSHVDLLGELRNEIVNLRGRDALAQMQIATLSAQVAAFAKAGAVVVWDAEQQRGILQVANLPEPAGGRDYQLWIIDPQYPAAVNGGVLPQGEKGAARMSFKPDQPIARADKFAISIEQAGGAPKNSGPIVFAGE